MDQYLLLYIASTIVTIILVGVLWLYTCYKESFHKWIVRDLNFSLIFYSLFQVLEQGLSGLVDSNYDLAIVVGFLFSKFPQSRAPANPFLFFNAYNLIFRLFITYRFWTHLGLGPSGPTTSLLRAPRLGGCCVDCFYVWLYVWLYIKPIDPVFGVENSNLFFISKVERPNSIIWLMSK